MYDKKQKYEIYALFLLMLYAVEVFNIFIVRKGLLNLYAQGNEPPWAIPTHILVFFWTAIYTLMGISGARIWMKRPTQIRSFALSSWVVQLVLNAIWPLCFFHVPIQILTPILVTVLFMALIVLMFYSYLVDKWACYLLIPYFLMIVYKLLFHWVFYILNISIL